MKNTRYTLNKEQKKAIGFGDGPLLIIAGAGSGKTTVITERIKHLISSGRAKPSEILALTFTEKASREMEERVDMALPYGVTQMWISTFHSFCDRVLKENGVSIGIDPRYKLMSEAETIQFFRSNLFAFSLAYYRPLGNPTKFISGLLQHFSRLKDEDISPEQYKEWVSTYHHSVGQIDPKKIRITSPLDTNIDSMDGQQDELEKYKELAGAYSTYEELKVRHSVMDYGDLIAHTLHLFRVRKNVLLSYQKQFSYILIDEFQDTNFAQNELALLLSGSKQNITVVGDDDQAIYRWRGAAISNIIQFRKHFKKAKIIVLTKNYRSTKEILDRSYQLIQHNNPDRLEVVEQIDKKLECVRRIHGTPIQFIYSDRVENEADEVATQIVQHITHSKKHDGTSYTWKDVAVLVRANTHAEPFIRAFGRAGVPYQFLGPGQLFRQSEVKDLICYLKVLYDIHDSISLFRVLSMDIFGISPRDIASLVSYARDRGISIFEAGETLLENEERSIQIQSFEAEQRTATDSKSELIQEKKSSPNQSAGDTKPHITGDGTSKIASCIRLIVRHLGLIKKETAGQILYYFLEETGLLKSYASLQTLKEEKAAGNIAKFFDKLKTYEVDHEDASVFTVVDWLNLSMDLGESPLASNADWNSIDAVNIVTVHSAKGLEFPIVFITNLVGARFPSTEKHEQIPIPDELVKEILPQGDYHLEEERRLFYVAMTRAKDILYFTASRYYGEGKREKKISPFVTETIGKQALELTVKKIEVKEHQLVLLDWTKQKEADTMLVKQPIESLSYSQIETYNRCPLQYKYRYVIKIPVPVSASLTFGTSIHRSLHALYEKVQNKEVVQKSILIDLLHSAWSSLGYRNLEYEKKMKDHAVELLEEFYDKSFDQNTKILALEQPFKIKIDSNLTLKGTIDRIDTTPDGKIEIIDYKTGSGSKKRDPAKDFQLSIYALAAHEQGVYTENLDNIIVSFYFLEGQQKLSGIRSGDQLEEVKQLVIQTRDSISTRAFEPTPGKHCDFCEFRPICEAWK